MAKLAWVILLCLAWRPEVLAATGPSKIIVAHAGMNARQSPLWIAQEQGFFSKYGIPTDLVLIRNAPLQIAALTTGSIQIGYAAAASVMGAVAGGSDMKIIAAITNRLTYDLVARPEIKKPEDLRGKRFGVQSLGGAVWMGALLGLEQLKLDARRDNINLLVVGDQTVAAQALEAGSIDVTVLDGVFSRRLHQKGFTVLAELYDANIPYVSNVIVGTRAYFQQHPQLPDLVVRSLIESLAFIFSPAKKPEVLKTLMRKLKMDDPSAAEEGYRDIIKTVSRKPYPSLEGMKNVQRLMKLQNPRVGDVNVESIIDVSYLRKLDESSFIDKTFAMYGVK